MRQERRPFYSHYFEGRVRSSANPATVILTVEAKGPGPDEDEDEDGGTFLHVSVEGARPVTVLISAGEMLAFARESKRAAQWQLDATERYYEATKKPD